MKRLPAEAHLTAAQARAAYRACRDAPGRSGWQPTSVPWRTDQPRRPAPASQEAASRPLRRREGAGKKLARAVEAVAPGQPGEGGRTVGSGRGEAGTQADRPPGLVSQGPASAFVRSDPLRVAVPVRVRPPQDRSDVRR